MFKVKIEEKELRNRIHTTVQVPKLHFREPTISLPHFLALESSEAMENSLALSKQEGGQPDSGIFKPLGTARWRSQQAILPCAHELPYLAPESMWGTLLAWSRPCGTHFMFILGRQRNCVPLIPSFRLSKLAVRQFLKRLDLVPLKSVWSRETQDFSTLMLNIGLPDCLHLGWPQAVYTGLNQGWEGGQVDGVE